MTGPECRVCTDPRLADIHRALDGGTSERQVARAFDLSRTTLQRHIAHRQNPPTTAPALVQAARPEAPPAAPEVQPRAEVLLEAEAKVRELADEARRLVREAGGVNDEGKPTGTPGTFRERSACLLAAARVLELLAKILGELGPDVEIRVLQLPQWQAVQAATIEALEPHPQALEAVATAWRRLAA